MRPEVEKYLEEHRKNEQEAQIQEKRNKREKILLAAGLYSEESRAITRRQAEQLSSHDVYSKVIDGNIHFFQKVKVPLDVTEEEYQAILATYPKKRLQTKEEATSTSVNQPTSGAANFFTFIAWVLWIVGLLLALAAGRNMQGEAHYASQNEFQFDFSLFISTFLVYFAGGCISMCFAELFKTLQSILNTLNNIDEFIRK